MALYRIEASEVIHFAIEVEADDDIKALEKANKMFADTKARQDYVSDYSGYQVDRVMVDNGQGYFEEIEQGDYYADFKY